jgi:hypothetical protein
MPGPQIRGLRKSSDMKGFPANRGSFLTNKLNGLRPLCQPLKAVIGARHDYHRISQSCSPKVRNDRCPLNWQCENARAPLPVGKAIKVFPRRSLESRRLMQAGKRAAPFRALRVN